MPYSSVPHLNNPAMMIGDAVQQMNQRLTKFAHRLRGSPGLGAFALPSEIILMIASHMDNPSRLALALTNRRIYSLCCNERLPLNLAEKEKLLLLLEKDIATLYFCHRCVKLHHWHRRWSRSICPWYEETMPCKRSGLDRLYLPHVHSIPYYYARLVMNRHLYGPTHGPPITKLEERADSLYYSNGVVKTVTQHARIINGQLYILSVISMSHSRGDSVLLRDQINKTNTSVCPHLTMASTSWPGYAPSQLPELVENSAAPSRFQLCQQAFGSCVFCLTDYNIEISWQGTKKGHVVKVFVYRRLGDCRSPFDWNWRARLALLTNERPRLEQSLDYKLGYVRDQWNKADGIESNGTDNWIEIPGMVIGMSRAI
jgi:hypothetical protein